MITLPVKDTNGDEVGSYKLDPDDFALHVNKQLLHDVVVMYEANQRQGASKTKSRGEVRGSTRKLYRQKGTGNARMGTARTIIRRGGGVAFAKTRKTETFRKKMPRRMRRLANRNALLAKLVDQEVLCVDSLDMDAPRTKDVESTL